MHAIQYAVMPESFLSRLLPNTEWRRKISSLIPSSRWGFFLGTTLVNILVFVGCWLTGTHVLLLSPKLLASTGLAAQIILIRKRESDIQPKRRWRSWYATILAILAFTWVDSAMGIGTEDRIRAVSQAVLGGFLLFQILILPVTVWCAVRKLPPP